jgi:hypothetical protein
MEGYENTGRWNFGVGQVELLMVKPRQTSFPDPFIDSNKKSSACFREEK